MNKFLAMLSIVYAFGPLHAEVKTYEGVKEVSCFGLVIICAANPNCEELLSQEAKNLALGNCFRAGSSQCEVVHAWKGEDCSFHAIARGQLGEYDVK